jgi:hypothetical protein
MAEVSMARKPYARNLNVGLSEQLSDQLDAAVLQSELSISVIVRRALKEKFERLGIKPPTPTPPARTRKHDREHQAAHL